MQTTRRSLGALVASLVLLPLAACGSPTATPTPGATEQAASVTVEHAQGSTTLDALPKRIVVLDSGSLDTISALGASDLVVGIAKGQVVPEPIKSFDNDKVASVGTLQEPDFEKIAELKPDLVIAGYRSAKQYPELAKKYKVVDVTAKSDLTFYDGVAYSTQIIAKSIGKEAEAEKELKELSDAIAATKAKVPAGKTGMILMTTGGKVGLQGPSSRYKVIHQDLGIEPAVKDIKEESHGDPVSFEAIQQANPDLMFVVDRDAAVGQEGPAAKQVLDNELVASTTAWKDNKVVYLDGARWYILIHGVNNAVAMVEEVAAGL